MTYSEIKTQTHQIKILILHNILNINSAANDSGTIRIYWSLQFGTKKEELSDIGKENFPTTFINTVFQVNSDSLT